MKFEMLLYLAMDVSERADLPDVWLPVPRLLDVHRGGLPPLQVFNALFTRTVFIEQISSWGLHLRLN